MDSNPAGSPSGSTTPGAGGREGDGSPDGSSSSSTAASDLMSSIGLDEGMAQTKRFWSTTGRRYQSYLDRVTPYTIPRWLFTLFLSIIYVWRVTALGGWFIVTYALGIYLLSIFIAFITPLSADPDNLFDEDSGTLPTTVDDEFRPFVRRLAEMKFWHKCTVAFCISFVCTLFPALDIPVFWPILLIYFIALTVGTLRNQIRHMIKYRYLPFTYGKKRYRGLGQQQTL